MKKEIIIICTENIGMIFFLTKKNEIQRRTIIPQEKLVIKLSNREKAKNPVK
jgi:hypothetical protein